MDKIIVEGGHVLEGTVRVSGAKNSALPILFASLLASGKHTFKNVPHLKDVESTLELLGSLNCKTSLADNTVIIESEEAKNLEAHYDLVRKMRASVLCLGPLISRYGFARVSLPGGCAIGARPINLHLEALEKMGATIKIEEGYVEATCKKLQGTTIIFDTVTVTGTENIMMAAVLAEGTTLLENAAKEPEIVDLAEYLNKMGAKITGHGTSIITIKGVGSLKATQHEVMPDRIEAGTLVIAGAITGGEVTVEGFNPVIIESLIMKLSEIGFKIQSLTGKASGVRVSSSGKFFPATDITTQPYPGFATDLQAQFMALMCVAQGTSIITETIFENRFMHVTELSRLGADIAPKSRVAIVRGKPNGLTGAPVMATDLRASASLVLAGLVAKGKTQVSRIYHLDRGYENLEKKLQSLGASIQRVP
ncbi:MAG: UDP-N-acetylglucosamine 1-carboxyvinyltransferase [Oligoflexia bacterium]|nr:UDP-N-acetylglucosamine 1-carboxyvinyltransferase [Oligoflexia bacterium]